MACTIETLTEIVNAMFKEVKAIRKDIKKIRQLTEDPEGEKAKLRSQNSAFRKPLQISDDLRTFLNLPAGELISRSDVTKRITGYANENGLKTGNRINLDEKLKKLLDPPADLQITFLNLQTYVNKHYIKPVAPVAEPVIAEEPKKKPTLKKKV
jgi:chromatin remodeling complex protein RSC6